MTELQANTDMTDDLDIVWGARAIGLLINRNSRVTYGLLEAREIPGARKVGNRWCVSRHKLREAFGLAEAA